MANVERCRVFIGSMWVLAVLCCWLLGSGAAVLAVPSPYLVASAVVGISVAASGRMCRQFPGRASIAAQAVIGTFLGSYIDFGAIRPTASIVFSVTCAILATIVVCLLAGWVLPRLLPVDALDGVLGMTPGNPSALVGLADDAQADSAVVAFIQYLRVTIVAASIPIIIALGSRSITARASSEGALFEGWMANLRLVESDRQILGVAGVGIVCVAGYLLGRLVRLPAPAITGPLLLSAAVPQVLNELCNPSELVRQLMFVVIGLEMGLRFQRAVLQKVWRLVPRVALVSVLVGLVAGVISAVFAVALGIPFVDGYLAVAPGGLNPIMASAVSANADVLLVASVQTLRLLVALVVVKLVCRWLINRRARSTSTEVEYVGASG